jgi:hypothetical protein
MDPEKRTLLEVKFEEMEAADGIFTKLMGDLVAPRRAAPRRADGATAIARRGRRAGKPATACSHGAHTGRPGGAVESTGARGFPYSRDP